VAGDGATSIPLSDGRVLWLFGDSHVDDFDPDSKTVPALFQVRNAAMIHSKDKPVHEATRIVNSPPNQNLFQHPDGGSNWFWPQAGFETGGAVFVHLVALTPRGKPGNFDFKTVGHYWAKMPVPDLQPISYFALPDFTGIDFGCGFVRDEATGHTLAFGQKASGLETSIYLARFKTTRPDRDWQFWNGKTWDDDASKASAIARSATVSISACKVKDRFLLISSALSLRCDMGKEIFVSTSDKPTGPFSTIKKIYTLDDTLEGHYPFFYLPSAHPELITAKTELLVTYSINGYEPCVPISVNGRMNPDHYRPKAIRVPLSLIFSDL
jgi:hypothetical protein